MQKNARHRQRADHNLMETQNKTACWLMKSRLSGAVVRKVISLFNPVVSVAMSSASTDMRINGDQVQPAGVLCEQPDSRLGSATHQTTTKPDKNVTAFSLLKQSFRLEPCFEYLLPLKAVSKFPAQEFFEVSVAPQMISCRQQHRHGIRQNPFSHPDQ